MSIFRSLIEKIIIAYLDVRIFFAKELLIDRTHKSFVAAIDNCIDDLKICHSLMNLSNHIVQFQEDSNISHGARITLLHDYEPSNYLVSIRTQNIEFTERYFDKNKYHSTEILEKKIILFILSTL